MEKLFVQYGSGRTAPKEWVNFDASLSLRLQKIPVLGWVYPKKKDRLPGHVRFGDIITGLPGIKENSCDGVFCSHVLEHLALEDFRKALRNTYKILKPGGLFRLVIPDLEPMGRDYVLELDKGNPKASEIFLGNTWMGRYVRPRGIRGMIQSHHTYTFHLWMWDKLSMQHELKEAGFKDIRICTFNDSKEPMFKLVEEEIKYATAFGAECTK
jgi:predicted SAM-dependent methyltransferase